MRFGDFLDYCVLRRYFVRPWRFIRLRKRTMEEPFYDIELKPAGVLRIRNAPMDARVVHRIFARDEYRLKGFRPGSLGTVVDIGAHIGAFAVRVAPLARRVLSVEPVENNFELLARNVSALPVVTPFRQAISAAGGIVTMYLSKVPAANSLFPNQQDEWVGQAQVPSSTLARFFEDQKVDECDLLKLDVEGAEHGILYSVPDTLWSRIKRICLEYDPVPESPQWTGQALAAHLEQRGYDVDHVSPDRLTGSRSRGGKGYLWAVRRGLGWSET